MSSCRRLDYCVCCCLFLRADDVGGLLDLVESTEDYTGDAETANIVIDGLDAQYGIALETYADMYIFILKLLVFFPING